jgi:hypothetical protein
MNMFSKTCQYDLHVNKEQHVDKRVNNEMLTIMVFMLQYHDMLQNYKSL